MWFVVVFIFGLIIGLVLPGAFKMEKAEEGRGPRGPRHTAKAKKEAWIDSLQSVMDQAEKDNLLRERAAKAAMKKIEENVAMTNDYCHGITKMSKDLNSLDLSESGKWGALLLIYQNLNDTYCSTIHRKLTSL